MSWDAIRQAIEQYASDNWTDTPITWANLTFSTTGVPWVRLTMLPVSAFRNVLGHKPKGILKTGILVVTVFTPANTGSGEATRLADKVETLFLEKKIEIAGANPVTFFVPSQQVVNTDPEWFQINVRVEFEQQL